MGTVTRDEALSHAQDLMAATPLPVSGDFENGFGDDPDTCAETVRLSGEIGLAGICIEDTALPDTQAFDQAGADGLYIPIPPDMDALKTICKATDKPVNVLAAGKFTKVPQAEFANAGAARISLGSALARATHKAILDAAKAMFDDGDFSQMGGIGGDTIDALLDKGANP